jgi:hypothetical protein
MKNKITSVLRIALILIVLAGLLIPAASTSAGVSPWTVAGLPSKFIDGSNITAIAVSPDGNTILAFNGRYEYPEEAGDYNGFVKSTDGGLTFSGEGLNDSNDEGFFIRFDSCTQIVFSPQFATDKVIVAVASVDGAFDAYISYDSGKSWEWLDDSLGNIVSADVSYDSNGKLSVLMGTHNSVYLYTEKSGNRWMDLSEAEYFFSGDILDVKFSPNYADDAMVLALTNSEVDGATMAVLQNVIIDNHIENTFWNESYKPFGFQYHNDYIQAEAGFMAFGDGYSANSGKVFVALTSETCCDVYKAVMQTGSVMKNAVSMNANEDGDIEVIYSLDYQSGKIAIGAGGYHKDIKVNTKADTSTSADDWTSAADETKGKVPSGINFKVAFSANASTLYAATSNYTDTNVYGSNAGKFGSVFASSTNYRSFDGLSLINVKDENLVTVNTLRGAGSTTQYAMMKANFESASSGYAPVKILFKSTDSGQNWKELISNAIDDPSKTFNDLAVIGDDVWIPMKESQIIHSSNGGITFDDTINVRTQNDQILAFCGGTDYWIGGPGGEIFKNGGRDPIVLEDIGYNELFALIAIPGFFVVLTTFTPYGPPDGPIYFSGDGGVTFKKLGDKNITSVTFDIPGKLIYGLEEGTNDIYSYNVETGTDWTKVCTIEVTGITFHPENIDLTGNGVLYVKGNEGWTPEGRDPDEIQYIRTTELKLANPKFEAIPASSATDFKNAAVQRGPTAVVESASGNTLYKVCDYLTSDDIPKGKIRSKLMTYSDVFVNGPVITTPAANSQVPANFIIQWDPAGPVSQSITYNIQIAVDSQFQGTILNNNTKSCAFHITSLPAGSYYARVKVIGVYEDSTLTTRWSAVVPFTVSETPSGLYITSASQMPDGEVKAPYSETLEVINGTPPYTWSVKKDSKLPAGLTLKTLKSNTSSPIISGKPTKANSYTFSVVVTDYNKVSAEKTFTILVVPALELVIHNSPTGEKDNELSWIPEARGGSEDYSWAITKGTLPANLELDPSTGAITGVPQGSGTTKVTLTVTDTLQGSVSKALTIKIYKPLVLNPIVLTEGEPGAAYKSPTFKATGGTGKYTWSIQGGDEALPPGLHFVNKAIKGTSEDGSSGEYFFNVQVSDGIVTATQELLIKINDPLEIIDPGIPEFATTEDDWDYELAAAGGVGNYKWSATGKLPKGVKLVAIKDEENNTTYHIKGKLSKAGPYTFTLKVTDSLKKSVTQTITTTVEVPD